MQQGTGKRSTAQMTKGAPPGASPDGRDFDELSSVQCWELLATQPVGRVAVVGHYPLVFAVNYDVDDQTIVYRTGAGTKLHSVHRSNVTFEADEIDTHRRTGWSVMIKGVAQELSPTKDRYAVSRVELTGAAPWAPGERDHVIRIVADQITGRRIRLAEVSPPSESGGR